MKTLPEILEQAISESATDDLSTDWDAIQEEAQKAIAKELMGIIGEDETHTKTMRVGEIHDLITRNEFRDEVRARLTAFIGHKEQ